MLKVALGTLALAGLDASTVGCSDSSDGDSNSAGSEEFAISGRPNSGPISDSRVPIFWIESGVCTGCAVSLLGSMDPTIETVLPLLRLEFQETLMDRSSPGATDRLLESSAALANQYVLIVDGTIPSGATASTTTLGVTADGYELTAQDLITQLAQRATAIVALGTCASFGGIAAAAPNPANHRPLADFVPKGKPLVRLPGCPPHPGWIIEVLQLLLTRGTAALDLDSLARPTSIFGGYVHDVCSRRDAYENGEFAESVGDPSRCFLAVGCKGPQTSADCPKRPWGGQSTCIESNHPCIGCAAPGFPDARSDAGDEGLVTMSPIYT
jgi:hydrogenase small subunit